MATWRWNEPRALNVATSAPRARQRWIFLQTLTGKSFRLDCNRARDPLFPCDPVHRDRVCAIWKIGQLRPLYRIKWNVSFVSRGNIIIKLVVLILTSKLCHRSVWISIVAEYSTRYFGQVLFRFLVFLFLFPQEYDRIVSSKIDNLEYFWYV